MQFQHNHNYLKLVTKFNPHSQPEETEDEHAHLIKKVTQNKTENEMKEMPRPKKKKKKAALFYFPIKTFFFFLS